MFQIYCLYFEKPVSDSLLVEQIEIYSYEALFTSRKVSWLAFVVGMFIKEWIGQLRFRLLFTG